MVGVGNIVSVGGSVGGGGSGSGIQVINPGNNTGPTIDFQGVNGVQVTSPSTNVILVDAAGVSGVAAGAASGLCYAVDFSSITSATITHGLGTTNVVVNVYDSSDVQMIPDKMTIVDLNSVALQFNRPQTGKVVIVACGGNDSNFEECRRYALLVS